MRLMIDGKEIAIPTDATIDLAEDHVMRSNQAVYQLTIRLPFNGKARLLPVLPKGTVEITLLTDDGTAFATMKARFVRGTIADEAGRAAAGLTVPDPISGRTWQFETAVYQGYELTYL